MNILNFFEIFEILKFKKKNWNIEIFWIFSTFFEIFIDFRILKFYEIFERDVEAFRLEIDKLMAKNGKN